MNKRKLKNIESEFNSLFSELERLNSKIKSNLEKYSDNKILKGDELVGWLGEIYGKILLEGKLVNDSFQHDFEVGKLRFSVKTRKGFSKGWQKSGLIRAVEGKNSPTHLLFVHLNNDYTVDRIWKFSWNDIVEQGRIKKKTVRGLMIGWQFSVRDKRDGENLLVNNR